MAKPDLNEITPEALSQLRENLRDPAALAVLAFAVKHNWLTIDQLDYDKLFAPEIDHPASALLHQLARTGGAVGLLEYSILAGFFGLTFLATMFSTHMPPILFVMWGALGVAGALLARRAPALFK